MTTSPAGHPGGQTVVVLGGSSGIGLETARLARGEGADVIITGRAPVRVNVIAAGFVDTPLSASLLGDRLDERREQLRTTLPIGRVVGPDDIATLAVHLMANTAVTGATYDIDGGQQLVNA
jgi:NAD(P)-dependent dehydrogenase (short-subunit alcohol dehydrogenase family)